MPCAVCTIAVPCFVASASGPDAADVATALTTELVVPLSTASETDGVFVGADATVATAGGVAPVAVPASVAAAVDGEGAAGRLSSAPRLVLTSTPCPAFAQGA